MSAATTTEAPDVEKPSRAGRLLDLVRRLIDYGKELAATLQLRPTEPGIASVTRFFGITDIALILARITSGLHRAQVLEARLVRNAKHLDAPPRLARVRTPRAPRAAPPANHNPLLAQLPTSEQIAAKVRRQPIGVVIADICRDLGIAPSHPLWRELSRVIIKHGGSLAALLKHTLDQVCPLPAPAKTAGSRSASPTARRTSVSTGPP
jgi:hypothetical protein